MSEKIVRKYGWKKDKVDIRDFKYAAPPQHIDNLPPSVDLRPNMPPIYDQKQLSSCTANAICAAVQFDKKKQGLPDADQFPSRLFVYYNERDIEGSVNEDGGASIRDGIKSIASQGVCSEGIWPYLEENVFTKPTDEAYNVAKTHLAVQYHSVNQDLNQLKACLTEGYPIVCGIMLYSQFESQEAAKNGIITMPQNGDQCLGGHAVQICGYNDDTQQFTMRNSWGPDWGGNGGYFFIPYQYITNPQLSCDFWTVRLVQ